jgi:hypothetical protein
MKNPFKLYENDSFKKILLEELLIPGAYLSHQPQIIRKIQTFRNISLTEKIEEYMTATAIEIGKLCCYGVLIYDLYKAIN